MTTIVSAPNSPLFEVGLRLVTNLYYANQPVLSVFLSIFTLNITKWQN